MRIIDKKLLDEVTREAQQSPRLRKNRNFHPDDDFPCHRLLNAMEPGSYIRPHCHLDPAKDETMVVLRGSMAIISFDPDGRVTQTEVLSAGGNAIGVDIPHGTFHTVVSLANGTLFLESKAGPYRPLTEAEQAGWAPVEDTPAADGYLAQLKKLVKP